ncbi:hypothetical protein HGA92_02065 [Candidatus Gracilibacteria bacterium]|nr:hypothetical protein [Candidatus Gracilibacteria bacterium]NUJ99437.1 hypothetical protein [Candidatus Gracilibacteria bacterium]
MFLLYIGAYSLILLVIWGFFIVARLHSYKFKNFSTHIPKATNALFFILLFLSLLGLFFIFVIDGRVNSVNVFQSNDEEATIEETYY